MIVLTSLFKGIIIIHLECSDWSSSNKGDGYLNTNYLLCVPPIIWIYVWSCYTMELTTILITWTSTNYLLCVPPIESKPLNTRSQLCCLSFSCSEITWSGEYCTLLHLSIHYSSQLFLCVCERYKEWLSCWLSIDTCFAQCLIWYISILILVCLL